MNHIRLFTHTGGVVRFSYDMNELLDAVNQETQFVGRNLADQQGNVDLNKMAGPDDIEFVVRSIKAASNTLDAFIPKHAKTEELRVVVFSNEEATLTFSSSGFTSRTVLEQAYEHARQFMLNFMLRMWYEKVRMGDQAGAYAAHADLAVRTLQRVLIHSFIVQQPYGSRYPRVKPGEVSRPLKGKFLGSYRSEEARDNVHESEYEAGDICYVETEYDYMVYDGSEWKKIKTVVDDLTAGEELNALNHADYPEASAGDVFYFTKGGTIGNFKDRVYAGEALVCIKDNQQSPAGYKDTLENFIVIGPVRSDEAY